MWLSPLFNDFDGCMLWAAAALCFLGFFLAGELTARTENIFELDTTPTFAAVDNVQDPSTIQIHLKASKTDPFLKGVDVYVRLRYNDLCLIRAMVTYLSCRGGHSDTLFQFRDQKYLTRSHFVVRMREALH